MGVPALSRRSTLFQAEMVEPIPSFFSVCRDSCIRPGASVDNREKAECDL